MCLGNNKWNKTAISTVKQLFSSWSQQLADEILLNFCWNLTELLKSYWNSTQRSLTIGLLCWYHPNKCRKLAIFMAVVMRAVVIDKNCESVHFALHSTTELRQFSHLFLLAMSIFRVFQLLNCLIRTKKMLDLMVWIDQLVCWYKVNRRQWHTGTINL